LLRCAHRSSFCSNQSQTLVFEKKKNCQRKKKGEKIAPVFDVVKLNFYGVLLLGEIGGLRFCVWLLVR
jgi:nitrate reductase NapE component